MSEWLAREVQGWHVMVVLVVLIIAVTWAYVRTDR